MSKQYNAETTTEYRTPARSAQVGADVLVPLCQAIATGFFLAIAIGAFTSLKVGALTFAVVSGVAWTLLLLDHRRLLWSIEKVVNADIDHNGHVGPPPEPGTLYINADKARHTMTQVRAEQKRAAILRLVYLIDKLQSAGRPSGQKVLRGERLPYGYKCSDEFHSEVGTLLVDNGLAVRNSDNSWTLTASYADVETSLTV